MLNDDDETISTVEDKTPTNGAAINTQPYIALPRNQ